MQIHLTVKPATHFISSCRTGTLQNITKKEIEERLGFKNKMKRGESIDGKVTQEWRFTVGKLEFAIWDYKGSAKYGQYSTYGDPDTLRLLFPNNYRYER